jgi:hypothetical protein
MVRVVGSSLVHGVAEWQQFLIHFLVIARAE